tara:strand:+ start:8187 stop:10523 length:2337 start_codon:yes stop_codon:yes gene_type:complete
MARVRKISAMSAALKKYSDTKSSIFSTAKEQGEQQRANREDIEFKQRGLTLQKNYLKKQRKLETASMVLNLASTIGGSVAKGQQIKAGGEQIAAESGEDFSLHSDKFGADRPVMNLLETLGQGAKSAFGIYDSDYEIGGKTYSQQELSYLSKFPGADINNLGYDTPASTTTSSSNIAVETLAPTIAENASTFSMYKNDSGESLIDYNFSEIDFNSGKDLMMPKLNEDGTVAINPETNKVELEVWSSPTTNIDSATTSAQYYTELETRRDAISNYATQLEDSMWNELEKDMMIDNASVADDGFSDDNTYVSKTTATTYKDRAAIIKDGILMVDTFESNISPEDNLEKGKVIKVPYNKLDDESGKYDTENIKKSKEYRHKRNLLISQHNMNPDNMDLDKSLSQNLFYEKYGKENVIREFGDIDLFADGKINYSAEGKVEILNKTAKGKRLFKKIEKWQNGKGRIHSGEDFKEMNRLEMLQKLKQDSDVDLASLLNEDILIPEEADKFNPNRDRVGGIYLTKTDKDGNTTFQTDSKGHKIFLKDNESLAEADVQYAMEVWRANFPNQEFTHEKYGYDWAQTMINQVGLETANQVTNLTPMEIKVPWKIPDEKTREFVMGELMMYHDIRISEEEKHRLTIQNALGQKDTIGGETLITPDDYYQTSSDPIIENLESLETLPMTNGPLMNDGYSEDPTYGNKVDTNIISEVESDYNKDHSKKTQTQIEYHDKILLDQDEKGIKKPDKPEYSDIIDSLLINKFEDFDEGEFYKNPVNNFKNIIKK